MIPGYAELHCLTNYSFLRGASGPEELVHRAAELGYKALAITDHSLSPLARHANQTLIVAAAGLQGTSVVAAIALADALVAAVALRQPQKSMRVLERGNTLYHGADLLLD